MVGKAQAQPFTSSRTLALITPDAVSAGKAPEIERFIAANHFAVLARMQVSARSALPAQRGGARERPPRALAPLTARLARPQCTLSAQ